VSWPHDSVHVRTRVIPTAGLDRAPYLHPMSCPSTVDRKPPMAVAATRPLAASTPRNPVPLPALAQRFRSCRAWTPRSCRIDNGVGLPAGSRRGLRGLSQSSHGRQAATSRPEPRRRLAVGGRSRRFGAHAVDRGSEHQDRLPLGQRERHRRRAGTAAAKLKQSWTWLIPDAPDLTVQQRQPRERSSSANPTRRHRGGDANLASAVHPDWRSAGSRMPSMMSIATRRRCM
jgi:hypothetical protein